MTDVAEPAPLSLSRHHRSEAAARRLRRRYAAERRFRAYGIAALAVALGMLAVLLATIVSRGYTAFVQTEITLDVFLDPAAIDPAGTRDRAALRQADYQGLLNQTLYALFPEATTREDRRELREMLSVGAGSALANLVVGNPDLIGQTISFTMPTSDDIDQLNKGHIDRNLEQSLRTVSDKQLGYFDALVGRGLIAMPFNTAFFTNSASTEPELAGVWGAVVGSFLALIVCLVVSFPMGIATAIYLEEFAPRNRWTDLIEVNINNLAAVPSIIFGLLGLAVFIQVFGLPNSAPLVGGLVLSLMTLPIMIIASRAALKAVPPSIREAALGMGASKLQTVMHHVLPLAMPGMLTGTIIGMAHALGETAPLLMIGMVAFIVSPPAGLTDPATVLPVQIFLWADSPERGFVERTSAAILVLLAFLIAMNAIAVFLRKKFERRW